MAANNKVQEIQKIIEMEVNEVKKIETGIIISFVITYSYRIYKSIQGKAKFSREEKRE
jgi:phosphotransferase system IIA component